MGHNTTIITCGKCNTQRDVKYLPKCDICTPTNNEREELTQQVCSLELAQRLQELGVKQESFFRWECRMGKWSLIWNDYHQVQFFDTADLKQYVSAFTVAELGEMLPDRDVSTYNHRGTWYCESASWVNAKAENGFEANARAKLLIYLLENKLITL